MLTEPAGQVSDTFGGLSKSAHPKDQRMNWTGARGETLTLVCGAEVSTPAQSLPALCEFWTRLCAEASEHYPDGAFRVVFCELWPDSGRLVAYPADRPPVKGRTVHQRNERVCLQVTLPWLQARFDGLPDPDVEPVPFGRAAEALSAECRQILVDALRQPAVVAATEAVQARASFRVCLVDGDELLEIRLGPKPKVVKWRDSVTPPADPAQRAAERLGGMAPAHVGRPVVVSGGAVHAIDLADSQSVTDADLAELALFPKLEKLDLRNTSITDAGLEAVGRVTTLRQLGLHGTRVTDVGLRHLSGLARLWKVKLGRTGVTSEGIAWLKSALPQVKVEA